MRSLLRFFFFDLLILTTFWPHQSITAGETVKPPNLIIIITDDHGYHDVGFNGCTDIKTPNLDSLAQNGIRFTQGYVSAPICGPSRAGLLTGRYQDRFGFNKNPSSQPSKADETEGIPLEEENIAEVLKKVGYKNAVIGKWHMGAHPVLHPLNRGFDHFFGFLNGGHAYFPEELKVNDLSMAKTVEDSYRTRILNDHEKVNITDYLTDELTDAANRFIDGQVSSDPESPFFLYLAYNAPHGPLQATPKYLDRFPNITDKARRTYAAMVSAVDDGVGRVHENLRNHGIEEETLVVFLSDNGGAAGHGSINLPLRGFKGSLFEGGMHVPFAMQWKGTLPAGQDYTYPIISLDIMATITDLAGADISSARPLDGVNLVPYLTGEIMSTPHPQLFWRKWGQNVMAVMQDSMKVVTHAHQNYSNHQLYNLQTDLGEAQNLRDSEPDIMQALIESWNEWNAKMKDGVISGGW